LTKIDDPARKELVLTNKSSRIADQAFSGILSSFMKKSVNPSEAGKVEVDTTLQKSITDIHAQIEKLKGIRHE
jgi:hypothetical protein